MLRKIVNAVVDRGWRIPRGLGKPLSSEDWNKTYSDGSWDHLHSLSERPRYAVIRSYALYRESSISILDVGCGDGMLRSMFADSEVRRYVGVDLSRNAIEKCDAIGFKNTKLFVSHFDEFEASEDVDIVIFNECLGYADDPEVTFRRYWNSLNSASAFIVSIHDYDLRSKMSWKRIERVAQPVRTCRVKTEAGQAWDIKLFIRGCRKSAN